jgi:hypothetical protein
MIQLTRNTKRVAAFLAVLVSVSAAGMSPTMARAAQMHSPVTAVAVLPAATRVQRKRRAAATRSIRWWLMRRLRQTKVRSMRGGLNLPPRLPVHDSLARGPPRPERE